MTGTLVHWAFVFSAAVPGTISQRPTPLPFDDVELTAGPHGEARCQEQCSKTWLRIRLGTTNYLKYTGD